jgi:flagellar basal body P-ring formation protein FlgA
MAMHKRLFYRFGATAVALMLLRPLHATAAELTDPTAIRAAAEQAVRVAAGTPALGFIVSADAIDARLRLSACSSALRALITGDGQLRDHTTVGVYCDAPVRWAVYLGVSLATEIPVLVAQHALAAGTTPDASAFSVVTRRLPGLSSHYLSEPAQLAGQRLRRAVAMGEALAADAVLTAPIVHRGQQLTLLARTSSMDVRVTVIALADGKPDERIRVQNPSSQRIVEAIVRSAQLVEVFL